jgi:hypothetical protein
MTNGDKNGERLALAGKAGIEPAFSMYSLPAFAKRVRPASADLGFSISSQISNLKFQIPNLKSQI